MENKDITRDHIIHMLEVGAPWSAISNMLSGKGADAEFIAKIQTDINSYAVKPGPEPKGKVA